MFIGPEFRTRYDIPRRYLKRAEIALVDSVTFRQVGVPLNGRGVLCLKVRNKY
jgi:hypothetical protein